MSDSISRKKQNVWRAVQGLPALRLMEDIVHYYQNYVETYTDNQTVTEFPDEVFIEDMLYGMGVSMSTDYQFNTGFNKFKEMLLKRLLEDPALKLHMKETQ